MKIYICWTTVDSPEVASQIAKNVIDRRLAFCAQVEGPIESFYNWQGSTKVDREWRICIKTAEFLLEDLEIAVKNMHNYETPQWLAIKADAQGHDYHEWAARALII